MDSNTASSIAASVSAVAASVAALVAVAALYIQGLRARSILRIELLFRFNDRFSDEHLRAARSSAANALLNNAKDLGDVDDVLDFFESMGLMVQHKALDPEMVWSEFSFWIDGWWCAAFKYIQEVRSDDATIWEYFWRLREHMMRVEKRWTKASDSELVQSREDVVDFLKGELSLTGSTRRTARRGSPRSGAKQRRPKDEGSSNASAPLT